MSKKKKEKKRLLVDNSNSAFGCEDSVKKKQGTIFKGENAIIYSSRYHVVFENVAGGKVFKFVKDTSVSREYLYK